MTRPSPSDFLAVSCAAAFLAYLALIKAFFWVAVFKLKGA